MHRPTYIVKSFSIVIVVCLALTAYFSSHQQLHHQGRRALSFAERDDFTLPPSPLMQVLLLNYDTFASSIAWIGGLLYFGEWRTSSPTQPPEHIQDYAAAIRDLDPDFIQVFDWFDSVYIGSHHMPGHLMTYDELEVVRQFNETLLKRHPNAWKIYYTTGLNYIGYSQERTPEQRAQEYAWAIHYLERCARFPQCPSITPLIISNLYERRAKLLAEGDAQDVEALRESERQFYTRLYKETVEDALRARLASKLLELGVTREEVARLNATQIEGLRLAYQRSPLGYLPLDLWVQVVYPTEDAPPTLSP